MVRFDRVGAAITNVMYKVDDSDGIDIIDFLQIRQNSIADD